MNPLGNTWNIEFSRIKEKFLIKISNKMYCTISLLMKASILGHRSSHARKENSQAARSISESSGCLKLENTKNYSEKNNKMQKVVKQ